MGNVIFNETTTANVLNFVKINLGISSDAYDTAIKNDIGFARRSLADYGLNLDETDPVTGASDAYIVIMFTTWLWRERENGAKMPRMLETAINDRFTHQIMTDVTRTT